MPRYFLLSIVALLFASPAIADEASDLAAIKAQLKVMQHDYDTKIHSLEVRLAKAEADAKAARQKGVCVIGGLVDDYATCVAASVAGPGGKCVASICFIVSNGIGWGRIQELTRLLMDSARNLSRVENENVAVGQ